MLSAGSNFIGAGRAKLSRLSDLRQQTETFDAPGGPLQGCCHHRTIRGALVPGAAPGTAELADAVRWIDAHCIDGGNVLVHCVGGLGRAGTVSASWLKARGLDAAAAIATVRSARSARAIETKIQEEMIERFTLPG